MPVWILYSIIATLFAGLTAVLVKSSIREISADMSMAIRIGIVFVIVLINLFAVKAHKEVITVNSKAFLLLVISGVTTGLCWIFYYKAINEGDVSVVSAIDKGSIVITVLMAVVFLGEPFTLKLALGAGLILLGTVVLVWKV